MDFLWLFSIRIVALPHPVMYLPLPQVQKIAGHSNITTTAIYLHFSDEVDANLEKLGY
jgi:hypothetical protein